MNVPPASTTIGSTAAASQTFIERIDHHFGAAGGHQQIAVAIAPGAADADRRWQPADRLRPRRASASGCRSCRHSDVGQSARAETCARRGGALPAFVPGPLALGGVDAFVERAECTITPITLRPFALDSDQRSVERHAVNERLGAVDRVENPAIAAGAGLLAELFAQDAVGREMLGDSRSRSNCSASRSAIVTGELSALSSTARSSRWKYRSVNRPASRAALRANSNRRASSSFCMPVSVTAARRHAK